MHNREKALAKGRRKKKVFTLVFGGGFISIGVILFVIGVYVGIESHAYQQKAMPVEATIVAMRGADSESLGTPVVEYSLEGVSYTSTLHTATSSMHPGKRITVYYQEGNPWEVRYIDENGWIIAALLFMSFVFAGIGGIFLVMKRMHKRNIHRLLATGDKVEAEITDISNDRSQNLNGKYPIVIACKYVAPNGRIYLFQSGPFWYESYEINPKKKVCVYIDRNNPSSYYVDVDSAVE